MSLENVLEILQERRLTIIVGPDGKAKIKGKKGEITDAVREALSVYREEIIDRFRPKMPRRIVLLAEDGEIEKVLEECEGIGHHERIQLYSEQHPGRTVAGEWRRQKWCGGEEWIRFATKKRPLPEAESKVSEAPVGSSSELRQDSKQTCQAPLAPEQQNVVGVLSGP